MFTLKITEVIQEYLTVAFPYVLNTYFIVQNSTERICCLGKGIHRVKDTTVSKCLLLH